MRFDLHVHVETVKILAVTNIREKNKRDFQYKKRNFENPVII